jgi:Na+/H+ antiporter NhaB
MVIIHSFLSWHKLANLRMASHEVQERFSARGTLFHTVNGLLTSIADTVFFASSLYRPKQVQTSADFYA